MIDMAETIKKMQMQAAEDEKIYKQIAELRENGATWAYIHKILEKDKRFQGIKLPALQAKFYRSNAYKAYKGKK